MGKEISKSESRNWLQTYVVSQIPEFEYEGSSLVVLSEYLIGTDLTFTLKQGWYSQKRLDPKLKGGK